MKQRPDNKSAIDTYMPQQVEAVSNQYRALIYCYLYKVVQLFHLKSETVHILKNLYLNEHLKKLNLIKVLIRSSWLS